MAWEKDEGSKLRDDFDSTTAFFELGKVSSTKRIGGRANKNYQVITDEGRFIVKFIIEHPLGDLETELNYLARLQEHDYPAAYYLKSPDGSQIFQHNGNTIVALPELKGDHPDRTPELCRSIGANIANLHSIPHESLPDRNHWLKQSYMPRTLSLLEEKYPKEVAIMESELEDLKDLDYSGLPQSIIHGDMSPENCLYEGGKLVAILDWEEVGVAPSVLDIGTCVLNLCFEGNKFNPELFTKLIEGYESVRPLSKQEKDSLLTAVRYAGLTLTVWNLYQFGVLHPDEQEIKNFYWDMGLPELQLPVL